MLTIEALFKYPNARIKTPDGAGRLIGIDLPVYGLPAQIEVKFNNIAKVKEYYNPKDCQLILKSTIPEEDAIAIAKAHVKANWQIEKVMEDKGGIELIFKEGDSRLPQHTAFTIEATPNSRINFQSDFVLDGVEVGLLMSAAPYDKARELCIDIDNYIGTIAVDEKEL
jgi:hypothetical protein